MILPASLRVLDLGSSFNQKLDLRKLRHLESLRLGNFFNNDILIPTRLLGSLEELELGYSFSKRILPAFTEACGSEACGSEACDLMSLFPSLKRLSILCILPSRIRGFPSLECLELHNYKYPLPKLPLSLKSLKLYNVYSDIESLPDSLEDLSIINFKNTQTLKIYISACECISSSNSHVPFLKHAESQKALYLALPRSLIRLHIKNSNTIIS